MLPTENQCNGISGLDCCYTPPVTVNKMSTDENGNSSSKSCISHKLAVMKPQASLELLPPMPSGLEPMKHQLAGHKFGHIDNSDLYGILDCKDGTILKPVIENKGQREKYFYELINGVYSPNTYFRKELYELDSIRQLAEFTPKFLGLISLPEHPDVSYVKMDDISHGLIKPNILDVKIGAQCWSHDASVNKQQRQKLRCPHLDGIRFQILGAKYYDCDTGKPVVNMSLRKCTPHDLLHTGLYNIFRGLPKNTRIPILEKILTNLRSISDWFRTQTYLSFRGSSLLIVFEGDCDGSDSSFHAPFVQVKMIDFVHVWESSQLDSNYLDGIKSLMSYIISLIAIFKG